MIHVIVVGEGQTEETFTNTVLAPHFANFEITVEPRLVKTSECGRGGALSKERVIRFLRNTLRERGTTHVTTFFDLYGLHSDFPGVASAGQKADPLERSDIIEAALAEAAVEASNCRADRFVAHIQPYEFEALLFSDVSSFAVVNPEWRRFEVDLKQACDSLASPEHINDGATTHPSARLTVLHPRYKKTLHGCRVAASIGLTQIRQECQHFDRWLTRIESLDPL